MMTGVYGAEMHTEILRIMSARFSAVNDLKMCVEDESNDNLSSSVTLYTVQRERCVC